MEIIKCFEYRLYKFKCDESIYLETKLNDLIHTMLNSEYANEQRVIEGVGNVVTTNGMDSNLTDYDESTKIVDWIKNQILAIEKFNSFKIENIKSTRSWVNKMEKGSEGLVHTHKTDANVVAIFYLSNSENGSNLVVTKNTKENISYLECDETDVSIIETNTGDLILHESNIPHAVSLHQGKTPRICLVFEFEVG